MTAPTAAERAQVVAGLRELANLLEEHPELPVPKFPRLRVTADDVCTDIASDDESGARAFVDRAAGILGIATTDSDGHYDVTWLAAGAERFEGDPRWRVEYNVGHISTAAWAEHAARTSYESNVRASA